MDKIFSECLGIILKVTQTHYEVELAGHSQVAAVRSDFTGKTFLEGQCVIYRIMENELGQFYQDMLVDPSPPLPEEEAEEVREQIAAMLGDIDDGINSRYDT